MVQTNTKYPLVLELAKTLNKPIGIMDTETTGLLTDPNVRIVEYACVAFSPDGKMFTKDELVNPEVIIPKAASNVHGIYEKDVCQKPNFTKHTKFFDHFCKNWIFSGFNSKNYDFTVLKRCYSAYGLVPPEKVPHLDVRLLWTSKMRTKKGKLSEVADALEVNIETQHRALGDVLTSANVLEKMILRWGLDFVLESFSTQNKTSLNDGFYQKKSQLTKKSIAFSEIKNHLKQTKNISFQDMVSMAKKTRLPVSTFSFAISEMLEEGQIVEAQVVDESVQEKIEFLLLDAIDCVGREKLKPIKEYLDKSLNQSIEYIQLKIALNRLDEKTRSSMAC